MKMTWKMLISVEGEIVCSHNHLSMQMSCLLLLYPTPLNQHWMFDYNARVYKFCDISWWLCGVTLGCQTYSQEAM